MSASDDQNAECPLCMEPLELDDLNFFPCTCGYQICRFCWHRIRTDENGLCPACRKQYPEDPADFKPLTHEELQRIKNEKRLKDLQRKQKMSENRKHLANVRVVQKNLVFVVGLSQRLAETEVLKRNEYFGKFGKIHKVVINHTTSYAGSQVFASRDKGPSASAYVTYCRTEDALRAIQAVNNIHVDGRTLKASLGTTKYCSHFLKGQACPKPECMYLHEIGDDSASFTKEEMQLGKHQEYEKKLHEQLCNSARKQSGSPSLVNLDNDKEQAVLVDSSGGLRCVDITGGDIGSTCTNGKVGKSGRSKGKKENGSKSRNRAIFDDEKRASKTKVENENPAVTQRHGRSRGSSRRGTASLAARKPSPDSNCNGGVGGVGSRSSSSSFSVPCSEQGHVESPPPLLSPTDSQSNVTLQTVTEPLVPASSPVPLPVTPLSTNSTSGFCTGSGGGGGGVDGQSLSSSDAESPSHCLPRLDSSLSSAASSLSSSSADALLPFFDARTEFSPTANMLSTHAEQSPLEWMRDSLTPDDISVVQSDILQLEAAQQGNTDWQAAFGFTPAQSKDDDLGFDPWDESSKALADLMEKETDVCPFPSSTSNGSYGMGHIDSTILQQQRHFMPNSHMPPATNTLHGGGARHIGAPPGFSASHPVSNAYSLGRSMLPAKPQLQQQHFSQPNHLQPPPLVQQQPHVNGLSHSMPQQILLNGHVQQPLNLNHGLTLQQPHPVPMHQQPPPPLHHQAISSHHHHPFYGESSPYVGVNDALPKVGHHLKEIPGNNHTKSQDTFCVKEWQDNLRALFPNVNITFGGQNGSVPRQPLTQQKGYISSSSLPTEGSWVSQDPAVLSAGCVTTVRSDSPPHWMKSLQQLTEVDLPYSNHRVPVNHFAYRNSQWSNTTQIPPPGFGSALGRATQKPPESQKMIDSKYNSAERSVFTPAMHVNVM